MPPARPKPQNRPANDQHYWGMLIFESISAGGFAVFIALSAVLVLAGVYGLVVWPLTHWDLAHVDGREFAKWALIVIFSFGASVGFWVFSGAAFKKVSQGRRNIAPRPKYRGVR